MIRTCDSENNNLLYHSMNMLMMLNSDEETVIIVMVMDYLVKKIRSASRIPKQVSTFTRHDRMLNLEGHDGRFVEILRMHKACFIRFCGLLEENEVRDTKSLAIKEQLMMFLIVVGYCDSSRRSGYEWNRSTETISRHFNNICSHLVWLASWLIDSSDFDNISLVIANNPNYFPYFQVCTFFFFSFRWIDWI